MNNRISRVSGTGVRCTPDTHTRHLTPEKTRVYTGHPTPDNRENLSIYPTPEKIRVSKSKLRDIFFVVVDI